MNISIDFNWPTGQSTAAVSLGSPNIFDSFFELSIGAVRPAEPKLIHWAAQNWSPDHSKPEVKFLVNRTDKVIVHQKVKGGSAIKEYVIDIDTSWPADAHGSAFVVVPHYLNNDPGKDKKVYCQMIYDEYKRLKDKSDAAFQVHNLKDLHKIKPQPAPNLAEMVRETELRKLLKNQCRDCLNLSLEEWFDIENQDD